MARTAFAKLNAQIYSEASEWFVNCRSGTLDDDKRRKFDAWLRQSPQHLSAYLELAAIWDEGPTLDANGRWDPETLIADALADQSNVTTLITPPTVRAPATISHARWAAVIAFVAIGLAAFVWVFLFREPIYVTQVGEQRSITLSDGSTIELNSRSKVRVRYSEHERALELLEGQALFRVAHDTSRPFIVTSDGTRVRAVGTQFDVNRKREGTVVTVVEGRVSVLTDVSDARVDAINVNVSESMPQLPHPMSPVPLPGPRSNWCSRRRRSPKSPRSSTATTSGNSSCKTRSSTSFTSVVYSLRAIQGRCCSSCVSAPGCVSSKAITRSI
jgi:transmembrane sensor